MNRVKKALIKKYGAVEGLELWNKIWRDLNPHRDLNPGEVV